MFNTTFQRQGDPVTVGWSIGRAPLRLRGIRFAEGDAGTPPAAPPATPAPSPTDVAAMLAHLNSAPPAAPPAPAAPAAPVAPIQGFTPEQVQKLMADSSTAQKAAADAQAALATMQQERDAAQAQIAEHARTSAVTTAAGTTANAALLLDSAKFQAEIKDVDLADPAKLAAAVTAFVTANPAYAAAPAAPQLPGTSGPAPAGSTTTTPKTLESAIAARLAG